MTTAASYASRQEDPPLARVRMYASLFTILFCEFFEGPVQRFIARGVHAKASAFLRGIEALVRRVLLIEAAAMIPTLPPAVAKRASGRTPRGAAERAGGAERPPSFQALRRPFPAKRAARAAGAASPGKAPRAGLADLRPLGRRYEAIMRALEGHEAAARRLAFRLRPLYVDGASPQIIDSPRLHPEHTRYLARDLDILREDANDALRAANPDTS